MPVTLVLKLLLAPLLVVGSSYAGRVWGDRISGVLVGLPIVAGPILLIICLEHGTAFGASAAASSLLGIVTLALFVVVFTWASLRWPWWGALLVAWIACLAADLGLGQVTAPAWLGFVLVLGAILLAHRLLPRAPGQHTAAVRVVWPWWDLPARAAATAALVLAVTTASGALGPGLSGVLAPFPIATSVVAAFALAQGGPAAAIRFMGGLLTAVLGFAVFCLAVALLVDRIGIAAAFTVAVAGAVVTQLVVRAVRRRPGATGEGAAPSP